MEKIFVVPHDLIQTLQMIRTIVCTGDEIARAVPILPHKKQNRDCPFMGRVRARI